MFTKDGIMAVIKFLPYMVLTGIIIWLLAVVLSLKTENVTLKIDNSSLTQQVDLAKELSIRERDLCEARIAEAINKVRWQKTTDDINTTLTDIPDKIEAGEYDL